MTLTPYHDLTYTGQHAMVNISMFHLRIEVHFLLFALENERTQVTCKSC